MRIIKIIASFLGMVLSGMYGGQKNKAVRRFGLPSIALATGLSFGWNWRYLAFIALIPVLMMGYGVDSQLGALLGHCEPLIRLVYALLLALPFVVFGLLRWVIASVALVIVFQIHAGSLGYISWFGDVLVEDILRYSTLALLILFCIIIKE